MRSLAIHTELVPPWASFLLGALVDVEASLLLLHEPSAFTLLAIFRPRAGAAPEARDMTLCAQQFALVSERFVEVFGTRLAIFS